MADASARAKQLRVGMIPYWNLLPLRVELQRQYSNLDMDFGAPSQVNQWLHKGVRDIGPCSSVCLLSQPNFEMALPLGVASNGPVKSVYIGFHHEHEPILEHIASAQKIIHSLFRQGLTLFEHDGRKVARHVWAHLDDLPKLSPANAPLLRLSSASASGVALTKLLYRMWFGEEAFNSLASRSHGINNSGLRPLELLIGDDALMRRRSFYKILDLGQVWKELSDLPFVFAVWQSRGACLNGWRRRILAAGELAESKMKVDPFAYIPASMPNDIQGKPINLSEYWKVIDYKLGPSQFRGLVIFLCLVQHLQKIPLDQPLAVKLMRWQEISQTGLIPQL